MARFMTLPKIGVNMVEGTISEWLVSEGDEVKFGEMAFKAETDKDIQDIPADQSGIVLKILANPGDLVQCKEPVAIVGEAGEKFDDLLKQYEAGAAGEAEPTEEKEAAPEPENAAPAAEAKSGERVKISPLAKKMAKEMGIDYTKITPKGARISKADILAYKEAAKAPAAAAPPAAATAAAGTADYTGIRKVIGTRMTESIVTKPMSVLTVTCDMTKMLAWRAEINQGAEKKVGVNVLIAKACARALRDHPMLNAQLSADGDKIHIMEDVNIGFAVDTGRGLMVPVLRNVDKKGVLELSDDFAGLVDRVKQGNTQSGDLSGGTFTISNLGSFGVEFFKAIVNPPECAILAVGAVIKQPVVIDDEIVIRPMMKITLSFDHRIVDGAPAARFLVSVKANLEDPLRIIL
ncbi:MAG: 2-oxo acid dehydrogenase subunit E2 [Clostridiales bacterium]|jgi:pyruvate dehydrogenase E2 component (dihydrolipoamide acetyltransferase)|nr:2-oxo acid dehydrogenase subunit E2 [Clostridiales bacterium]